MSDDHLSFCKAIFVRKSTNSIFFDYPTFKTFARSEEIHSAFTEYILTLIRECIDKYGSFEMHMNLKSFSITAAQRYSNIIRMFCNRCLQCNTEFSKLLTKMYLYNSPRILGSISAIFIGFLDDHVRSKIQFIESSV